MKQVQDHYYKKAKQDGYQARSAYKLEEVQAKNKILEKGYKVLDLGCYPGSWMQYISKLIGPKGLVLGVDRTLLTMGLQPNMKYLQADILELDLNQLKEFAPYWDVVVSDMAPNTTGNRIVDSEGSWNVCAMAMDAAQLFLKTGGSCLVKSLQGVAQERLIMRMRAEYSKVKTVKPDSSRSESKEVFVLGQGKKPVVQESQDQQESLD
ncbi:MAG: RlmE family RNA methyltransferase [SAR324 cluster bacterium]|nr:RlmE family RNA methyltransferase [SAR324 cluster bacterium]